ncbi:Zn-dependent alcohol dehydrogenase [Qipengyuania sp. DY56-A-20]|jgi:S-(hydroxymethyl)glutathione dehydrogenase / alcohol dehydrogenase|uniref:Zn-dependent alcohol dehydrogenase n=1 Tax=Qipengyuania benthica TaxID=3067651 RepID=A0ABT9H5Y6_9SPHN|nr:Zn-dependent alcohol dehydrogenase [Qipengyuania sp. DY56-A-20]MBU1254728.1 Zn-dependent alcohol dehydrogenase [Alphaproteobacteria bacterium]MBU1605592.1 Zn-dependent alcohol dehydrogenase [Alphaproteobacteria bacterium]MDP4538727.1 Zn-dependent alcohol dehydrogenase [Qipengyuania sp. DY56-A-20]
MAKAAILESVGKLTIGEVELADPLPHEVLIDTKACGLCHSDLHFIDGAYPHPMPAIPGHEAAGVVRAVGSEVKTVKPGDHVVTCLSAFCGHCEFCVTGRMALCMGADTRRDQTQGPRITRAGGDETVAQMLNLSAFAEQMLIHEHACVAIDKDMPLDRAAVIGCAVTTGAGAVFNACSVVPGESVAVIGCGGVGLAAINAARIAGAGQVIAIDPIPEKRELAKVLGATHTIDAMADDAVEQVMKISRGGVHHAIEAVGRQASADLSVKILRRGGMATILGMMPLDCKVGLGAMDLLSGKKLQGAIMGMNHFPVDLPRLVDFYMRGLLDLDTIISERIALEDINKGFDTMRNGHSARSVIVFD